MKDSINRIETKIAENILQINVLFQLRIIFSGSWNWNTKFRASKLSLKLFTLPFIKGSINEINQKLMGITVSDSLKFCFFLSFIFFFLISNQFLEVKMTAVPENYS